MSLDRSGTIAVTLHGSRVKIDRVVFVELFDNSVVSARVPYRHALERSTISFSDLVDLARTAHVPYALCFAPRELVRAQVETKLQKLVHYNAELGALQGFNDAGRTLVSEGGTIGH